MSRLHGMKWRLSFARGFGDSVSDCGTACVVFVQRDIFKKAQHYRFSGVGGAVVLNLSGLGCAVCPHCNRFPDLLESGVLRVTG